MTINSRAWGVGWYQATALPSIPGRTARSKAIYLLQIAAEVEHALMAQYLYVAYSLDETFNHADGSETVQIVDRWKRDLRLIARQEMAHFVTVQNLLICLGAEVYVNRENNFSDHPDAYPFPVRFEKFTLDGIARYVATEAPAPEEIRDKRLKARLERVMRNTDPGAKGKINRVGILYAALYWLFLEGDDAPGPWRIPESLKKRLKDAHLAGVHIDSRDFAKKDEYREFAASSDELGIYESSLHVDDADPRARALSAINWIMIQGEGPSGTGCSTLDDSHFCRFLDMYEDLQRNPALAAAAREVPLNPVVADEHRTEPVSAEADSITDPESVLWAKLFNARYQMLLLDLLLALSTSRETEPDLRKDLMCWATRNEMEFLKQIGQLLPNLPRHAGSRNLRAGAPFEMVQFPLDNTKRWDQQRILMNGSTQLARQLESITTPKDQRFSLLQAISEFDRGRRSLVEGRASVVSNYVWREGNQRITRTSHGG